MVIYQGYVGIVTYPTGCSFTNVTLNTYGFYNPATISSSVTNDGVNIFIDFSVQATSAFFAYDTDEWQLNLTGGFEGPVAFQSYTGFMEFTVGSQP